MSVAGVGNDLGTSLVISEQFCDSGPSMSLTATTAGDRIFGASVAPLMPLRNLCARDVVKLGVYKGWVTSKATYAFASPCSFCSGRNGCGNCSSRTYWPQSVTSLRINGSM